MTEDEDVSPPSAALRYPCSCFNRPATLSPLSGQTCAPPPRAINQQSRSTLPTNTPDTVCVRGFSAVFWGLGVLLPLPPSAEGGVFAAGMRLFPLEQESGAG